LAKIVRMSYKNEQAAVNGWKNLTSAPSAQPFWVYQFPKGHWNYASVDSPVGQSLKENGMIYPENNCKAQQFRLVQPK
jgi:hypothetical protein